MSEHILGVSGSAATLSLSLIPGFFPQGHSRRPTEYHPTPSFKQEHLLLSRGKLTCSPQSSWKGIEDNVTCCHWMPVRLLKARHLIRSELASQGEGEEGMGKQPRGRD